MTLVVGGLMVAACLQYGIGLEPLLRDRAYHLYMGQAVLRGEAIYRTTTFGYPPLGPLLSAAVMFLGRLLGVPTYLSPRLAGVLVAALAAGCLYVLAWRAFRSQLAGLAAGVALASFGFLSRLSIANLEPKALVMLFVALTALAVQKRRWFAAGFWAALAVSCWQPAILVAVAAAAVILAARPPSRVRAGARGAAGFVLGSLPSAIYVTAGWSWGPFLQLNIALKALNRLPGAADLDALAFNLARLLYLQYQAELLLLAVGAAGFIWFVAVSVDRKIRGRVSCWLHPRYGGVPLLTLLAVGYTALDVQGAPDLVPWLPLACFWMAWAFVRAGHSLRRPLADRVDATGRRRARVTVALLASLAAYGLGDALLYSPEDVFATQRREIGALVERAGSEGRLLAIGAPSVYAIAERRSPWRYLYFTPYFDPLIERVEQGGCEALLQRLGEPGLSVVVYYQHPNAGRCASRLRQRLDAQYRHTDIRINLRRSFSYTGVNDRRVWLVWRVYSMEVVDSTGAERESPLQAARPDES